MRNRLKFGDRQFLVEATPQEPGRVHVECEGESKTILLPENLAKGKGRLLMNGVYHPYFATETASAFWVTLAGHCFYFEKQKGRDRDEAAHGGFEAPMPGKVIQINVKEGDRVEMGKVLVVMEAMKMEHRIEAPANGTVTALHCTVNALVDQGHQLLEFQTES